MKSFVKHLLLLLILSACSSTPEADRIEELKAEIIKTEHDFARMAKEEGMQKAFLYYAAEEAVLNRNDALIKGKDAIFNYFEQQTLENVQLEWSPDFVDVSRSGDLAYSYGPYIFTAIDAKGDSIKSRGVFHTVWKKQADGNWKYVWD